MGKGEGKGQGKGKAAEHFDEATLEVYKECFRLMDIDKDGVINKTDLRAAFDNVGRLVMDDELNSMLSEVGGPCNYDNMIKMFEAKMAGGINDPDDLVVDAFKAFDEEGNYNALHFFQMIINYFQLRKRSRDNWLPAISLIRKTSHTF